MVVIRTQSNLCISSIFRCKATGSTTHISLRSAHIPTSCQNRHLSCTTLNYTNSRCSITSPLWWRGLKGPYRVHLHRKGSPDWMSKRTRSWWHISNNTRATRNNRKKGRAEEARSVQIVLTLNQIRTLSESQADQSPVLHSSHKTRTNNQEHQMFLLLRTINPTSKSWSKK